MKSLSAIIVLMYSQKDEVCVVPSRGKCIALLYQIYKILVGYTKKDPA